MTKKIEIPKDKLEDLYTNKKLSTHQIAKIMKCDPSVIQKRIKEHCIIMRYPMKKKIVSKDRLYDLYVRKKLSMTNTAKILGFNHFSVFNRLREMNIPTRKKKIVSVSKDTLYSLYINKKLSIPKIARMFNCSPVTIFEKLKKFDIKTRSLSEANTIYKKKKFRGTDGLKAYMIGFRLGDLNVKSANENSVILVSSNTTKQNQLNLIKDVYGGYGHFKVKTYNGVHYVYCILDKSFNFLIRKEDLIEDWILDDDKIFLAFLGGYTDAEGSFGVYQNRARFRIGSYDRNIIFQISDKLKSFGIHTKFRLESIPSKKRRQNKNFYRASVNEKESLLKFIRMIKRYIKHRKRYEDLIKCENNLLERIKKYETKIKI